MKQPLSQAGRLENSVKRTSNKIDIRNTVHTQSHRTGGTGVRTLKEILLTNIKAGENFGKALDMALDEMRKIPHTRFKKSAFELHYGREPNTEISNLLKIDALKN